jgi:hypothetical protein
VKNISHRGGTFLFALFCNWLPRHFRILTRFTGFNLCGTVEFDAGDQAVLYKTLGSFRCNMSHPTMELFNRDGLDGARSGGSRFGGGGVLDTVSPVPFVDNTQDFLFLIKNPAEVIAE